MTPKLKTKKPNLKKLKRREKKLFQNYTHKDSTQNSTYNITHNTMNKLKDTTLADVEP